MLFRKRQNQLNLDDVAIAAPCPIQFSEMEGDERVRFCSLCKLNVYNISEMTRKEASQLIESHSGQLCLKLYRRKDGTLITKDCPVGRRILNAVRQRARAAAFAFLALFNASAAFGESEASDSITRPSSKTENGTRSPGNESSCGNKNTLTGYNHYDAGGIPFLSTRYRGKQRPIGGGGRPPIPDVFQQTPTVQSAMSGTQQPFHGDIQRADRTVLDLFHKAQSYEYSDQLDQALDSYAKAISALRASPGKYDPTFASQVATQYAHLLRKQNRSEQAKLIEREFCLQE